MKNIVLSSARTVDRIAFATGWTLVMWMALYPGPLALQIIAMVLFCVYIISLFLCLRANGWSLKAFRRDGESYGGVSSVTWMVALLIARNSSPEVKEIVAGVALAILVFGLLYFGLGRNLSEVKE
ncbi:MAG: hypothetical protein K2G17_06480 [Duncaniella sp.]|nr:hypothetical protein [Duncaniella sp.]MDE5915443.1 hypothetical protein [Duncaniella sp.]MDE5954862.1 hypothetical protein [Duncaniella sp.]MDE5961676.1 hypothetical protein [Duncaniella sp.]MDE6187759.1 hypothetical protein [Duncaniella sp.]